MNARQLKMQIGLAEEKILCHQYALKQDIKNALDWSGSQWKNPLIILFFLSIAYATRKKWRYILPYLKSNFLKLELLLKFISRF